MSTFNLPYGRGTIKADLPKHRICGILESRLHLVQPGKRQEDLIREALMHPVDSPRLSQLAKDKHKVVIIASDHTRPVPSKLIIPAMLAEIRQGNPRADITILIATGCHRGTSKKELVYKFGEDIVRDEKILIHDCTRKEDMADLGVLPSGGRLLLNRIAVEADLLCAEGFIEPHFFAGFSGGRKSVLPGIAARETVLYNHCSAFIDSPYSRTGIIENNPIHRDMLFGAEKAGLAFIVNVVLNQNKEIVHAVAGGCDQAHRRGREFLNQWCRTGAVPADIVISTNGGYPLDQNIYQAVKGMTAAEATVKPGGVIIMIAKSEDGHGGQVFFETFRDEPEEDKLLDRFLHTPPQDTVPDQWQSQIFARVLKKARIIYVSEAPDEIVTQLHMTPARTVEQALQIADRFLGRDDGGITLIPDGVSVIVTQ